MAPPVEKVPAAQGAGLPAGSAQKRPAGQVVQPAEPGPEYVPGAQDCGGCAGLAQNVPAVQFAQEALVESALL